MENIEIKLELIGENDYVLLLNKNNKDYLLAMDDNIENLSELVPKLSIQMLREPEGCFLVFEKNILEILKFLETEKTYLGFVEEGALKVMPTNSSRQKSSAYLKKLFEVLSQNNAN